jgi:hypothetical protein
MKNWFQAFAFKWVNLWPLRGGDDADACLEERLEVGAVQVKSS